MNQTKFYLERISAIISIVLGSILGAVEIAVIGDFGEHNSNYITMALILLFTIAIIVLGALVCPTPKTQEQNKKRKGLIIALLVCDSVLVLFEFMGGASFYGLLALAPTVMLIVSLCLLDTEEDNANTSGVSYKNSNYEQTTKSSITEEIMKLSKLHESGVLTDEQYNDAIDKLVK